jgi:Tfp pilus assembly protein FimV
VPITNLKNICIHKKGDNLWNISKKYYGDGKLWRNILSANPQCLSRPGNVRTLKVGYVLTIPTLNNQSTIQTYSNQPKSQVQPAAEQKSSTIQTYSLNSQSTVKQALNNQKVNQEQEVEVLSETDSLSGQNTDAIKQSGGANILGAATQNNSNAINPASTGNTQKPTFVPSVSDLSDVE